MRFFSSSLVNAEPLIWLFSAILRYSRFFSLRISFSRQTSVRPVFVKFNDLRLLREASLIRLPSVKPVFIFVIIIYGIKFSSHNTLHVITEHVQQQSNPIAITSVTINFKCNHTNCNLLENMESESRLQLIKIG